MFLKTHILTLTCMLLMLAVDSSWPQSSQNQQEQDNAQQPVAPQSEKKSPPRKMFPQDVQGLQEMAIQSYQDGEYMRFIQATIKLREKRPYEPQYLVGMVVGAALLGRSTTAYNYMHIMQQQGLSYDFNTTEDTRSIRKTEVYDYLNDLLIKAGEPMGEGKVVFTLPAAAVQPQAIAWDNSRGKFLVGTIESGALLAVGPAGEAEELLRPTDENGLLAIIGIAVDEAHERLWVTTAGVPGFAPLIPTELGRGALMEFNLANLELLHRFDVPVDGLAHVPGSMAVTPSGDVYLIDRAVPMVFRKSAQGNKLEPYLASKELTGFKDIAITDAGNKLYLADAALGIAVVDLEKQTTSMLGGPETLNLGGISGLMYSAGQLLLLQNGIRPQRLMRLELDPSGMNVVATIPLAVALADFDAPSFGVIQGGAVYYFASSNLSGVKKEPVPVVVLKTPLELSEPIVPVEQRKFNADKLKKTPQ